MNVCYVLYCYIVITVTSLSLFFHTTLLAASARDTVFISVWSLIQRHKLLHLQDCLLQLTGCIHRIDTFLH